LSTFIASSSAYADAIVYSTFGPGDSYNTGSTGNTSWTIGGDGGPFGNFQDEIGASFVPSGSSYTLDSIRVGAFHLTGVNQLTVFLASGLTQPGSPIESFSVTGVPSTATILTFDSLLHPLLTVGTRYWVVLTETDLTAGDMEWNWNSQGLTGFSYRNTNTQNAWTVDAGEATPAFDVSGTAVPEPTSLLLLGGGLMSLLGVTRGKRLR
jgi:hypothetical protein